MIIDSHVHIGLWGSLPGIEDLNLSLNATLMILKKNGIEGAAILPSDSFSNYQLEEEIISCAEKDEGLGFKIWHFWWYHPGTNPLLNLNTKLPVKGVKIHGSLDKTPTNSPLYYPAYEFAKGLGIPVLIHCGRWLEMAGWHLAIEVAKKYRDIKFIFAHAGGNSGELRLQCAYKILEEKIDNVWLELSGMGLFWITKKIIRLLGSSRFLFGSDFPLGHPKIHLSHIEVLELKETEKEDILYKNAMDLLGEPSITL